jgi:uncharacterized protein YhjY with autotransporter beta-barrel domain
MNGIMSVWNRAIRVSSGLFACLLTLALAGLSASASAQLLTIVAGDLQNNTSAMSFTVGGDFARYNGTTGGEVRWFVTAGEPIGPTGGNAIGTTPMVIDNAAGRARATITGYSPTGPNSRTVSACAAGGPATFTTPTDTANCVFFRVVGCPRNLVVSSGNGQTGRAGATLASNYVVRVTDSGGFPNGGVTVTWAPGAGTVSPTTSVTDASGFAQTSHTLGGTTGAQATTASVPSSCGALSTSFSATAAANTPPNAVITSPDGATTITAGSNFNANVFATDSDGSVATVTIRAVTVGSVATEVWTETKPAVLGTSNVSFTWPNVPAGTYSVTATATDSDAAVSPVSAARVLTVTAAPVAPTATIEIPAGNVSALTGTTLAVRVRANDSDGTVASVTVTATNTATGGEAWTETKNAATTAPDTYDFSWPRLPVGTFALTASAVDNTGLKSSPGRSRTITVSSNAAPTARIEIPAAAVSARIGSSLNVRVRAADSDGTVASVTVKATDAAGTVAWTETKVTATTGADGYDFVWATLPVGTFTLETSAVDNLGLASSASPTIAVRVAANAFPTASIEIPAANVNANTGTALAIRIRAADSDGAIASVTVRATNTATNAVAFTETKNAATTGVDGYDFSWANLSAGNFTLETSATDNNGAASPPAATRTVSVTVPCVSGRILAVSGGGQTAEAGTTLANPYLLRVTGIGALPLAGVAINFTTNEGSVSIATAVTDANGDARTVHSLGATVGTQTVTASATGGNLCAPLSIDFSSTATLPSALKPTLSVSRPSGDASIKVGEKLSIRVRATNPTGLVSSVRAVITENASGRTVADFPIPSVNADTYEDTWTPTARDRYILTITATYSNAPALTATRRISVTEAVAPVRTPSNLLVRNADNLRATPGTETTIEVVASDSQGPLAGQRLNWRVNAIAAAAPTATSKTNTPSLKADCVAADVPAAAEAVTGADGVAVIKFTPGCAPENREFAVQTQTTPPVIARATLKGVAASVSTITTTALLTGKSLVALPNQALEVTVTTADNARAALIGVPISWTLVPASSGTVTPPETITNTAGEAKVSVLLNATARTAVLKACVRGTTTCVEFVLKNALTELLKPAAEVIAPIANQSIATSRLQLSQLRTRFQQLRNEQTGGFDNGVGVSVPGGRIPLPTGDGKTSGEQGSASSSSSGGPGTGAGSTERDISADGVRRSKWGVFTLGDIDVSRVNGGPSNGGAALKSTDASASNGDGYKLSTQGLTIGVDYRALPSLSIGAAVGGLRGKVEASANAEQRAKGVSGALFAQWFSPGQFYANAIANYGRNSYDISRFAADAKRIESDTNSRQHAFQLEGGYNYVYGAFSLSPYVRVEQVRANVGGINENGHPDAIKTTPSTVTARTMALGLQTDTRFSTRNGVWIPGARIEYLSEKQKQSDAFAQLVNGTPLAVPIPVAPFDSRYGNLGLSLQWLTGIGAQPISVFFGYDTSFGKSGVSTRRFTAGVKVPL